MTATASRVSYQGDHETSCPVLIAAEHHPQYRVGWVRLEIPLGPSAHPRIVVELPTETARALAQDILGAAGG